MSAKSIYQLLTVLYGALLGAVIIFVVQYWVENFPFWGAIVILFITMRFFGKLIYFLIHLPKVLIKEMDQKGEELYDVVFYFGYPHQEKMAVLPLSIKAVGPAQPNLEGLNKSLENQLNKRRHRKNLLRLFRPELTNTVGHTPADTAAVFNLQLDTKEGTHQFTYEKK